jgi:hypothetical protein
MAQNDRDKRTPFERLVRLGWEALDTARREPLTLDKITQNARDAFETARKGLVEETSLKAFQFDLPTDNAATANIELELSVGEANLFALERSDTRLMAADLRYLGSLSFGVSGDVQRHAFLRQSTPITVGWVNPVNWTTRPNWEVGLSQRVPLDLRVQGGVGDADLNLSQLPLQSLRVDGNIGPINITLPPSNAPYPVNIRGGAGPIALNIPQGANANVSVRGGVGGLVVNIDSGAAAQLNIAGGVGKTVMTPGFNRMEATAPVLPNTGTWETSNFHSSNRRTVINLADGMVGNVSVRVLEA